MVSDLHAASRTARIATASAILVTVLWSSSWILIKRGLADLPPLSFAGMRYLLAAVILVVFRQLRPPSARTRISSQELGRIATLGLVQFAVTQGAQFVALASLPAQTTSLALSTTPVFVALTSPFLLRERIRPKQAFGIVLLVTGAAAYLFPLPLLPAGADVGVFAALVAPIANAGASVLGRSVNRNLPALEVTAFSMLVGGSVLLAVGISVEGLPRMSAESVGALLWLSVVNTSIAFTWWNWTLRILTATRSSVINNTMLVQIAVLAAVFLGERLTAVDAVGLALASVGAFLGTRSGPYPRSADAGFESGAGGSQKSP